MATVEDLPTGLVTGQFLFVSQDNADEGTAPNAVLVTGYVRFTCTATPPLLYKSRKVLAVPLVADAAFDAQGHLIPLDPSQAVAVVVNGKLERGIALLGDSPDVSPRGFNWQVSFNLREVATGRAITIPSYQIRVSAGETIDLSEVTPVGQSNGVSIIRGESNYELAVSKGYTGTLEEWLESIKGAPGRDGTPGRDGANIIPTRDVIAAEVVDKTSPVSAAIAGVARSQNAIHNPLPFRAAMGLPRAAIKLLGSSVIGSKVNIGFLGSSTTAGHNTAAANRWVNLLAATVTTNPVLTNTEAAASVLPLGVNFINAAANGTTSGNYMGSSRGDQLAALNPRLVVHTIGANDYNHRTLASYKTNLLAAIDSLNSKITGPCTHLLVHSFERYDVSPEGRDPWSAFRDVAIEIAQERPGMVAFLDLAETFRALGVGWGGTDPLKLMQSDKVHLTNEGHKVYADFIGQALGLPSTLPPPTLAPAEPALPERAVWASDNFDREDTRELGSTPVGSKAWEVVTGTSGSGIGITNKVLTSTNGVVAAVLDPASTDVTLEADVVAPNFGLIGRLTADTNEGYYFMYSGSGAEWRLGRWKAGGQFNKIVGTGTEYPPPTYEAGAHITMEFNGDTITGKLNGTPILQMTETAFKGTRHGAIFAITGGSVDNFVLKK